MKLARCDFDGLPRWAIVDLVGKTHQCFAPRLGSHAIGHIIASSENPANFTAFVPEGLIDKVDVAVVILPREPDRHGLRSK